MNILFNILTQVSETQVLTKIYDSETNGCLY